MATEWGYAANYPATMPPNWWGDFNCSELEKAKYVARMTVIHAALGVGSFFNELWTNTYPLDISLLRRSFLADPISPMQPSAAYYVVRNLATALERMQLAEIEEGQMVVRDLSVRDYPLIIRFLRAPKCTSA